MNKEDELIGIRIPGSNIDKLRKVNVLNYGNLKYLIGKSYKVDVLHEVGLPINMFFDLLEPLSSDKIATVFTINFKTKQAMHLKNQVILFRTDGKNLCTRLLAKVFMFYQHLIESLLVDNYRTISKKLTKEYFDKFCCGFVITGNGGYGNVEGVNSKFTKYMNKCNDYENEQFGQLFIMLDIQKRYDEMIELVDKYPMIVGKFLKSSYKVYHYNIVKDVKGLNFGDCNMGKI